VTVTPSVEQPGAWSVRAAQHVGVIIVDEELEVRIRPKVPIDRLLFLVAFARDERIWRTDIVDLIVKDDLVASMGWAFAQHAEAALARGVLQSYVRFEEALQGVRGRLREGDQLRRHFGLLLPVEVAYDDYTVDIIENRLLMAACRRLLMLPGLPSIVRARLRHLTGRLDGVGEVERHQILQGGVQFTRLNERYRPAVRLAQAILMGTSLEQDLGAHQGVAFLFDMNRVFEDFVTETLGRTLERIGGRTDAQYPGFLDEREAIEIKPDLVWWQGGKCRAVIDAKYKATRVDEVPNADVYQAMAYSLALDVRPAFLIYAASNESPGEHVVVHSDLRVVVAALDISGAPAKILASVDAVASEIAGRTRAGPRVGVASH
jgi:5-methylcytosine-specific restriction enzyme subunit McrC